MADDTTIFVGLQDSVLILDSTKEGWKVNEHLKHYKVNALAVDLHNSGRAYCGTFDNGIWKTDNRGQTWEKISINESEFKITSISVSSVEKGNSRYDKLYVGTEPSTIFSSIDGGKTWEKTNNFNKLKSSNTWSFPPRPWTHHVRWIEPDRNKKGYIFVAIEAGALIKSYDGGKTWMDKTGDGPYDTHVLRTCEKCPGKLFSAAGDGYFESNDYGDSWERHDEGLDNHTYLFGLALNPSDPQNILVSASENAWKSHVIEDSESFIYRRSMHEKNWELVTTGLPEPRGTGISILESDPAVRDEFYCLNNRGIYQSRDSGSSWNRLEIPWPKEYKSQHPWALAIKS